MPVPDTAADALIREYLLLGLRFDRIEEGYVDSFTGDPALRKQVADEPAPDPATLARQARNWQASSVGAGIVAVARADAAVKGAVTDPEFALEQLLLTLDAARVARRA